MTNSTPKHQDKGAQLALTLGALGIVFGDIGTSPLYAMRECFSGAHGVPPTTDNILGILSLVFWSLITIISIKYLLIVMRADNHGEGGVLALMSLANPGRQKNIGLKNRILVYCGIIGAALLYGDGVITPAISVLGAVEGLKIVTPLFDPYIVPIAVSILFWLFYLQKHGTAKIGRVFGPLLIIWFGTLAVLGLSHIWDNPIVFQSINPYYAIKFFYNNGYQGVRALGGVFLVVTGGEALYADMGHFGKRPIQSAWFFLVLPALILNYLGQGALILTDIKTLENPFYLMAPDWALIPLVILATFAASIAAQAVISGAFSLTSQAVKLGYLPRLEIIHTSHKEYGQIYVAAVNWALLLVTVWLVLTFKSSAALASAYGIAVSTTMVITALLVTYVARKIWRWPLLLIVPISIFMIIADSMFLFANFIKIADGGWFPLMLGAVIFTMMTTWQAGRSLLAERLSEGLTPLGHFINTVVETAPMRIPGTAIFMCRNNVKVPPALFHHFKHIRVIHEKIILLMVEVDDVPYVDEKRRVKIETLRAGFQRMSIHFGFMEFPNVPEALAKIEGPAKIGDLSSVTFFLGKETLFATQRPGLAIWREHLFAFMSRNAQPATNFYKVPVDRVVELGLQVEL